MTNPTNKVVAVRACVGGHTVSDSVVIGMIASSPGAVDVFCAEHAELYETRLLSIGSTIVLQM